MNNTRSLVVFDVLLTFLIGTTTILKPASNMLEKLIKVVGNSKLFRISFLFNLCLSQIDIRTVFLDIGCVIFSYYIRNTSR